MKDVLGNPDIPWNWTGLSYNPNITIEHVLDNPDKDWNWSRLSENKFGWTPTPITKSARNT
jgi:hypothetical protein